MKKWSLKPDREMVEYLEGNGSTARPSGNKWMPKPRQDLASYPSGAAEPDEPKTGLDADDFLKAFNEWNDRKKKLWNGGLDVDKAYGLVREYGPLPKTEMEIQALLDLIPEEATDHAGVFISYLVNDVYQYDKIELRTSKPIGHIGTKNTRKRWVVIGNLGNDVGMSMAGGELIIRGKVANYLGWGMKGGRIVVEGNAGKWVDVGRKGGEIHINGTYESIWAEKSGAIYHKGRLIA